MIEFFQSLLSGDGFPARWKCGVAWSQEPWWGWTHIVSDLTIWASYFAIPIVLLYFVRKRRDVPFHRIFYLFAAFILACGATHLVDALIFYWPAYRLSGLLKTLTALISFATVVSLFGVTPKLLTLRSPRESDAEVARKTAELRQATEQLKVEIEERKRVNEELRDSREMLQLALTAGEMGFFSWNLSTGEVLFDPGEVRLTGLGTVERKLFAEEFFEHIVPEHRQSVRDAVQSTVSDDAEYDVRFQYVRPDGETIWMTGRGCVLRDADGQPLRFIGINQNVTDQVIRERTLDETAKEAISASEQKSRHVAQVSHEIRTPLTAMLGGLDALLPALEPGQLRDDLRTIRSQGEMLRILVNDVLDLAKIEAGRLKIEKSDIQVANVVADVCSLMHPLAAQKGLSLQWEAKSQLPKVIETDPYRLKQVLVNLVGNAIKFTDEGQIQLTAHLNLEGDTALMLEVRDTGIGIPNSKLNRIFKEFEQVGEDASGTGLGLAIAQRLICLMGGQLDVQSQPGQGSAFQITLPLKPAEAEHLVKVDPAIADAEAGRGTQEISGTRQPIRLLVAEDTRGLQFALRRLLEPMVEELVIVADGLQAIEAVESADRQQRPFDLILMDIQMPEMDGHEATRHLRKRGYELPIVALTAGAMESERKACVAAGCTRFLAKPIDVAELRRVLSDVTPR